MIKDFEANAVNHEPVDFSARDFSEAISPLFLERWSPRSFKNTPVSENDIRTILGAARWAPSSFNEQPWRFIISNDDNKGRYLRILTEGNQDWAKNAGRIGFILAQKHFTRNGKDNPHALFDCGAAWMALSLQARILGLYTRGMAGIRPDIAYSILEVDPDEYHVVMAFALGELETENENIKTSEDRPTGRRPLNELVL